MKALKLTLLAIALIPTASFAEEKVESPLEICKAKAAFQYHFDMMQIEGQEMRGELEHYAADARKSARHMSLQGELAVCESENKK
jgi:negative regulator of sigma E activity